MQPYRIKKLMIVFAVVVAAIVSVQVVWLNRLYSFEQRQFTTNVVKSIRGVFEDLEFAPWKSVQLQKLVERPDQNTFLIRIDTIPIADSLVYYLSIEMEDFDVYADCRLGIYDGVQHRYIYETYLPMAASHQPDDRGNNLQGYERSFHYILLYFPHRKEYVLHEMTLWIGVSSLLLLMLVSFAATLFYLYKQNKLVAIQSDFIKNITHEFQTPLTTIILGLDLLSKQQVNSQHQKTEQYLSVMKAQTDYLQYNLQNLLKVVITDSKGLKIHLESLSPNALISDVIHQLQFLIDEKKAAVTCDLLSPDHLIVADRGNLYLAILNLVTNALKFSFSPEVHIKTFLSSGKYNISIRDNGVGIPKRFHHKLFRKFYRVPTGDIHDVKGLGLGLYFVKKTIDLHKGKIMINNLVQGGTEFIMTLPI